MKIVKPDEGEILDIELEKDFLEKNRKLAAENRKALDQFGITAIDVMGSIGSGKTSLIGLLASLLKKRYRIAVVAGDLTTTIDAERITRLEIEVVQVNTGKECHLDANLIKKALSSLPLKDLDLVFIENVGNLICPAEFPLGAHKRVVIVSVTEGPWMVKKHPYIFHSANVAVINKIDLAEIMGVDPSRLVDDIKSINSSVKTILTSCREEKGLKEVAQAIGFQV